MQFVYLCSGSNTFNRIENEAEEYWSLLRFRMALEYMDQPPIPSPFIVGWHALLLLRFVARRLGLLRLHSALAFLEPGDFNRAPSALLCSPLLCSYCAQYSYSTEKYCTYFLYSTGREFSI